MFVICRYGYYTNDEKSQENNKTEHEMWNECQKLKPGSIYQALILIELKMAIIVLGES